MGKEEDVGQMSEMSRMMIELADVNRELQRKIKELEAAQEEIKTLSGLLPICMYCKSIRNDEGYWERVEAYLSNRSKVLFSHSICDECYQRLDGGEEGA